MAGPKRLQNIPVIFAALVGVLNQQRNRRSCGFTLIDTAQNLNHVWFLALGHMATGSWTAAVKVGLNVCLRQCHARRAAVDHTANGWAVGFTKVGDSKKGSKSISAHNL